MCNAASKRARVARRAQEKAATPEKRPAVDKVVQNAVLNGMPTLAPANPAAVIVGSKAYWYGFLAVRGGDLHDRPSRNVGRCG